MPRKTTLFHRFLPDLPHIWPYFKGFCGFYPDDTAMGFLRFMWLLSSSIDSVSGQQYKARTCEDYPKNFWNGHEKSSLTKLMMRLRYASFETIWFCTFEDTQDCTFLAYFKFSFLLSARQIFLSFSFPHFFSEFLARTIQICKRIFFTILIFSS